ncbi:MAG: 3-deoxy-manno-octulosonate cytidylyltransferase [Puniceicoccales bacterium]|jgi:3-deoxy-manno-octulosonate cytidylyltransferase (CMP-KDO synthetase)|nr:3-deoxy-manno-octulosonate cytidylyltransferase [Puniceicoccales bacterium]
MSVTVVIPARLASTRLPRKVLLDLCGKPVIQHVWERAKKMRSADRIVILADGAEIAQVAHAFGAEVILTPPECPSGTARLAAALEKLPGDFFLNIQGDEPCIPPELLDAIVTRWQQTHCELVTAVARLLDPEKLASPNVVKVVRDKNDRAIYFSRSPVPFRRGLPITEWLADGSVSYFSHIGVYGYTRDSVVTYASLPISRLEQIESLEQLRFIEHGKTFQTVETDYHPVSIDTPDDMEKARQLFTRGTRDFP